MSAGAKREQRVREYRRRSRTLGLQRVLFGLVLRNVYYAVDVERDLLGVGAPVLVAEAIEVLAIMLGVEGVVAVGHVLLEGFVLAHGVRDLPGGDHLSAHQRSCQTDPPRPHAATWPPYPKVNVQVAGAAKLAVADLEGDGHTVVSVELLVEAFAAVGGELDVVT